MISRVVLKNYKSIQGCDVRLDALTMLVGPNGSGKSNFVDAIKLTRDALRTNLENALRERGGIEDVRRRSTGHPTHFGIRLDIELPEGRAEYAYQVAARPGFTFEVQREQCRVFDIDDAVRASFDLVNGELTTKGPDLKSVLLSPTALALPLVGALPEYFEVATSLANMGFYSFQPDRVRKLQNPDVGDVLTEDGSNIASVVRRLRTHAPTVLERITEYLGVVVPGIRSVIDRSFGPMETIEFRQVVGGDQRPWKFLASSVSDGTLRALCVLIAAFQDEADFVAIEEPETAIHPGAANQIMDALLEAAKKRQLLLTTHSPDLLDHPGINVDSVVAVQSSRGTTKLGPVDNQARAAVQENLYSVGDLLRLSQVSPDVFSPTYRQARLF